MYGSEDFIMTGGRCEPRSSMYDFFYGEMPTFFPAYIDTTETMNNNPVYKVGDNPTGASFAIYGSTNDYVSGAYNYEFGTLIENLGPGDCILEKMTNPNQPNYLLYRESPTAPYRVIATL